MSDHDIYRILKRHYGFGIDEASLSDFDVFMRNYGEAISMEIMCVIHDSMKNAKKDGEGYQEFRLDLTLEKSKQFKSKVGEYLG